MTGQLKIIEINIKVNQAQYDLDRLAANEDLGYKPSIC